MSVPSRREFLRHSVLATGAVVLGSKTVLAQEKLPLKTPQPPPGFELFEPKSYRVLFTLEVVAPRTTLRNVSATGPLPLDWPEQQIELLDVKKPNGVTTRVNRFPGQAASLGVRIPGVPAGRSARIDYLYQFTRYRIKLKQSPADFRVPEKLPPELRWHLTGAPGVETTDAGITNLSKSLTDAALPPWEQVKVLYDWIRDNIQYQQGLFRGASKTLKGKIGDCEDQTALFVVLCRLAGIPARTVWIEGHAYPEFYLVDAANQGYWIPAEMTGPRWFGEASQYGPILQKGDRFRDPVTRRYMRYVPQSARAFGGAAQLKCTRTLSAAQ